MVARLQTDGGLGGLVAVSVVLHGSLLLLPMPQWGQRSAEPEIVVEESDAIAITTLPVVSKPIPEEIPPVEPPPPAPPEAAPPPPLTQVPDNVPEERLEPHDFEAVEPPEPAPPPE
ncbi:hypothetical protein IQ260_18805, partial [Leptolyngbya cf. ectocarpi LEGE 11479]|nr:hypothetical protein [Leptolyngbya cf. ectocarpi LEGE 11479]